MNTNAIWDPYPRMGMTLREFQDEGVLRIEISYTASGVKGEEEMLSPGFPQRTIDDLDTVLEILEGIEGIGFKLSYADLLQGFSE